MNSSGIAPPRAAAAVVAAAGWLAGLALHATPATAAVPETSPVAVLADAGSMPSDLDATSVVDDDTCMRELRQCCCPAWKHYVIFDVLFLQRDNQVGTRPLVFTDTGVPVMTTQDLQPSLATGINDNGGVFLQGVNLGTEARW